MDTKGCLLCFFLLLCFLSLTSSYHYMLNASVMGYPDSQDADLYREIARVMLLEERDNFTRPNYCHIHFNNLTFDTSSGPSIFSSLKTASHNFDRKSIAVGIGPYIDIFTSTDYVMNGQLHILTSSAGQKTELMDPDMVVSLLPEQDSLSHAVSKLVLELGWNHVAYLSQDDFSTVLTLGYHGIQVWPIRLPTRIESDQDPELIHNLIELRASQKSRYILHSTQRNTIVHVMRAAKRLHLLHHTISWLVDYPDFEDIIQDEESWPGTIYGLQLLRTEKISPNISYVAEQRNLTRLQIGLAVDVVGLLTHVLQQRARNCSLEPSTNSIIYSNEFTYILKDVTSAYQGALGQYMWHDNSRSNYTMDIMLYKSKLSKIGQCAFVNGTPAVEFSINITRDHDSDLFVAENQEEKLRVVARLDDPFVMKVDGEFIGFNVDILNLIAKKLNFSYEIFDVTDKVYSSETGEPVNGMVEELVTGNASMAVGALEVTAEKEQVISFSYTILSSRASILIRRAKSTRNFFQFLGPFSTGLWFMILAFILVGGLTLYIMSRFDSTQENSEQRFDLKESLWYSINVWIQGTTEYSPQTSSMRTIIAFFWFCVLIIDAAYTANLAAFLTLQQIDSRIRTVYDLAGQTEVLYGVEKNSNIMHFFRTAKQDPYERMWAFMKLKEDQVLLSNTSQIIQLVKSGEFAFIAERVINDYYALQHCELEAIEQHFAEKDFSLGFPRGAPYKDDVNRALLELKEEGMLDQLTKKWWSSRTNCSMDRDSSSVADKVTAELEITNMFGVFIVLGSFVVIAVFAEIVERIDNCVKGRKEKKKQESEEKEKPPMLSEGFQPQPITDNPEKEKRSLFDAENFN